MTTSRVDMHRSRVDVETSDDCGLKPQAKRRPGTREILVPDVDTSLGQRAYACVRFPLITSCPAVASATQLLCRLSAFSWQPCFVLARAVVSSTSQQCHLPTGPQSRPGISSLIYRDNRLLAQRTTVPDDDDDSALRLVCRPASE